MYCKKCGNKLVEDAQFCAGCGAEQDVKPKVDRKAQRKKALKVIFGPIIFLFAVMVIWGLFSAIVAFAGLKGAAVAHILSVLISASITLSVLAFPICFVIGLVLLFRK